MIWMAVFLFMVSMGFYAGADTVTVQAENYVLTLKDSIKIKKGKDRSQEVVLHESLSRKAVDNVVDEILKEQGGSRDDYKEIVAKIAGNYRNYLGKDNVLSQNYKKNGFHDYDLSMEIEFTVLKEKIRQELIQNMVAAGNIAKYDVYVEMYWAAEKSDIDPEVVDICRENIKKVLIAKGFNVVDFSAIRDRILRLKSEDRADLNVMQAKELDDFEKDFAISQVSKYKTGIAILSEYAQVLVGVTVRNIEIVNNLINIDIAGEAYLIQGGQRREIAKVDEHGSAPYVAGSKQIALMASESISREVAGGLTVQMQTYLAKQPKRDSMVVKEASRRWKVVFPKMSPDAFYKARKMIQDNAQWKYIAADTSAKSLELEYTGRVEDIADKIYELLQAGGFALSVPEYAADRNVITFGQ